MQGLGHLSQQMDDVRNVQQELQDTIKQQNEEMRLWREMLVRELVAKKALHSDSMHAEDTERFAQVRAWWPQGARRRCAWWPQGAWRRGGGCTRQAHAARAAAALASGVHCHPLAHASLATASL